MFVARINEILKRLKKDGWYLHCHGSRHDIYKHPIKKGRVVIPRRPGKELATGTLKSILKAAEL